MQTLTESDVTTAGLWELVRAAEIGLRRRAPSLVVGDERHFCVAVTDGDGAIASISRPSLIGGLSLTVQRMLSVLGPLAPGETAITNDPAAGSGHLQDFTILSPLAAAPEAGYAVACLHTADFGGDYLGSFNPRAEAIWAEAAVVPPLRLGSGGDIDPDLGALLEFNTRLPDLLRGDLAAAMEALARVDVPADLLGDRLTDALASTERRVGAVLAEAEQGSWSASTSVSHCCAGIADARIAARLDLRDGVAHVDFDGSAAAVPGFVNSSEGNTAFAVLLPCVDWLEPGAVNAGLLRHVTLSTPAGSIVCAPDGAPTGWGPYRTAGAIAGLVSDLLRSAGLSPCPFEHWTADPPQRFQVPSCDDPSCAFANRFRTPGPAHRIPPRY